VKVLIAGGSGFLGQPLADRLVSRGHEVVILTRRPRGDRTARPIRDVAWAPGSPSASTEWHRELHDAGGIVNLAGAGIADRRWTPSRKRLILESRVEPTRALVSAVRNAGTRPVFVQGSAIGYYGATLDDVTFDESSPPAADFLGRVCQQWETAAQPAADAGCRVAIVRTGIALDARGGALRQMARPFRLFVGGPVASGRQVMSWIHADDWIGMVVWALETASVAGVVNATAPAPVTNAAFSRALAHALRRPNWMPVPGFALRLLFGELADALLIKGQRVVPVRTQALGYQFEHPDLDESLAAIYPH